MDDLYVWTEPYDPQVARDAIGRVDRIASEIAERGEGHSPLELARTFPTADDCTFRPSKRRGRRRVRECRGPQ